MIRRYKLGRDVELHKRTLECGLLSLVGPGARRGRRRRGSGPRPSTRTARRARRRPRPAVATDAGRRRALRRRATAGASRPRSPPRRGAGRRGGGRGAPASSRGRPRYGIDLDDDVIPQEAGLNERAVSFTKGCYVGQETVARLYYRGKPNRHLRGLRLSAPAAPGTPLRLGEREVGRLGSVVVSPALGPIALALVRREAAPGDMVAVGDDGVSARSSTCRSHWRKLPREQTRRRASWPRMCSSSSVTASSDDLLTALRERARASSVPVDFMLVMPRRHDQRRAAACCGSAFGRAHSAPRRRNRLAQLVLP